MTKMSATSTFILFLIWVIGNAENSQGQELLESPNYPSNYPSDARCTYTISSTVITTVNFRASIVGLSQLDDIILISENNAAKFIIFGQITNYEGNFSTPVSLRFYSGALTNTGFQFQYASLNFRSLTCQRSCDPTFYGSDAATCRTSTCYNPCSSSYFGVNYGTTCPQFFRYMQTNTDGSVQCYSNCQNVTYTLSSGTCSNDNVVRTQPSLVTDESWKNTATGLAVACAISFLLVIIVPVVITYRTSTVKDPARPVVEFGVLSARSTEQQVSHIKNETNSPYDTIGGDNFNNAYSNYGNANH